MAQFDLKKAEIRFRDGYSEVGAVNLMAGYAAAATTMVIDGVAGIIPVGSYFAVGSGEQKYKIVSTIETGPDTTSITFTPGLAAMVADNAVLNFGGRQVKVKVGEGNLSWDENRTIEYILDRGVIDEVREGDEVPIDVNLDIQWQFITGDAGDPGGGLATLEDVLKQAGLASSWVSSDEDACRPYAVDIILDYVPACSTVKKEFIVLKDYRWEKMSHDAKAGTLSTSGKCNVRVAEVTRFTQ